MSLFYSDFVTAQWWSRFCIYYLSKSQHSLTTEFHRVSVLSKARTKWNCNEKTLSNERHHQMNLGTGFVQREISPKQTGSTQLHLEGSRNSNRLFSTLSNSMRHGASSSNVFVIEFWLDFGPRVAASRIGEQLTRLSYAGTKVALKN